MTDLQPILLPYIGAEDILKALRDLADQAAYWPRQAIYPADLLRLANHVEHQALIDAAEDRSLDWQTLLAVLEAET